MSEKKKMSRRGFIAGLGSALALYAGGVLPGRKKRRVRRKGPVEKDLREADFYSPHDLAG